jgi:hypothetical protein
MQRGLPGNGHAFPLDAGCGTGPRFLNESLGVRVSPWGLLRIRSTLVYTAGATELALKQFGGCGAQHPIHRCSSEVEHPSEERGVRGSIPRGGIMRNHIPRPGQWWRPKRASRRNEHPVRIVHAPSFYRSISATVQDGDRFKLLRYDRLYAEYTLAQETPDR